MREEKICKNCHQGFVIELEDFEFYEKIDVPLPTWCPDCRQMRRYAWRNERNLYRRNCDLCGKSTVTMYHPKSPYRIYCHVCWWGDGWDSGAYARDIDFTRPFFEQYKELQLVTPRIALLNKNSVNSEYTNHSGENKNLYLSTDCFKCEDSFYLSNCWNGTKDSCDVNMVFEGGEFLYECTASDRDYKCQFCFLTHDSVECMYCFDCVNCQYCFMSSNLRNRKYYFQNVPLSKEEYEKRIQELHFGSYKEREKLYKEWCDLLSTKAIYKYAQIFSSVNVSGDVIKNSRNIHDSYDIFDSDNIRYSVIVGKGNDVMDTYSAGLKKLEMVYESHALTNGSRAKFSHVSYDNIDIEYCDLCHDSHDLFGCVGMRKSEYNIFNKQYSSDKYFELREKLVGHMKKTGEYGEFFPPSLSTFGYNESQGEFYMPMTRDDALRRGFRWQDDVYVTRGKGTLSPDQIPDAITDVSDSITKEALTCISCDRNYNVVPPEIKFYKRMNIPIPRNCPECRYRKRIALRPPRKLWHRQCMCTQPAHGHSGQCTNEFETSYSPERKEIVYCEQCYQAEIV